MTDITLSSKGYCFLLLSCCAGCPAILILAHQRIPFSFQNFSPNLFFLTLSFTGTAPKDDDGWASGSGSGKSGKSGEGSGSGKSGKSPFVLFNQLNSAYTNHRRFINRETLIF